jgi:cyclic pyranopterin phosphate synthase
MDQHGRSVDYLRISVTDRCNERCLYCMPEGFKGWQSRADTLTDDEIVRVVRTACALGFRKFRVTGGEPLVRRGVVELLARIWGESGVETLGLSTNGTRLSTLAEGLKRAGVRSVNVSLDALDPDIYRRVTGGEVADVVAGVDAALAAGFERVKLNCVLMRGVNEDQIWPLVEFAAARGVPLRFIELMPLTRTDVLTEANFLPVGEVMRRLAERDQLIPAPETRIGHGPAVYHRMAGSGALVGFIGALTNLHFCEACNKMRLTADGKIRPCLGDHGEIDLLPALRESEEDSTLEERFRHALANKPWEHTFRDNYQPGRPMTAIGG